MDYSDLTNNLIKGNTRAAARLITIVENDIDAAGGCEFNLQAHR